MQIKYNIFAENKQIGKILIYSIKQKIRKFSTKTLMKSHYNRTFLAHHVRCKVKNS